MRCATWCAGMPNKPRNVDGVHYLVCSCGAQISEDPAPKAHKQMRQKLIRIDGRDKP